MLLHFFFDCILRAHIFSVGVSSFFFHSFLSWGFSFSYTGIVGVFFLASICFTAKVRDGGAGTFRQPLKEWEWEWEWK